MSIAELPIKIDRDKIAEFCRARGIRKLSVFGSVLREDFDLEGSGVDVLAEFEPGALKGVGFRYFGYGEELAAILGRKVDFVLLAKATDFQHSSFERGYPIGTLVTGLILVAYLVLTSIPVVRRLNDAGRDRGFVCLLLIPGINVLLLIYLMFAPTAKTHTVNTTTQQN